MKLPFSPAYQRTAAAHERVPPAPAPYSSRLLYVLAFAIVMGFVAASVEIYLRELFYPNGLAFPLQDLPNRILVIELFREGSMIVALMTMAALAGHGIWERFGWFLLTFGAWDIFYYMWLKTTLGWPSSLFEWEVLFLIPVPWTGPVIAPMLVALFMIVIGFLITVLYVRGFHFRPSAFAWVSVLVGTGLILFSFIGNAAATIDQESPQNYPYWMLILGLVLYLVGFWHSLQQSTVHPNPEPPDKES